MIRMWDHLLGHIGDTAFRRYTLPKGPEYTLPIWLGWKIREDAKENDAYVGPHERRTFDEVAQLFLEDRRANNCRFSTLQEYETDGWRLR